MSKPDYFMRARLAKGLHVEFSMDTPKAGEVVQMDCVWDPDVPDRITSKMLKNYQAAKQSFFEQIAKDTGMQGTVFDVTGA